MIVMSTVIFSFRVDDFAHLYRYGTEVSLG